MTRLASCGVCAAAGDTFIRSQEEPMVAFEKELAEFGESARVLAKGTRFLAVLT